MQRSFSIIDDDDDDEEVFLPEEDPKETNSNNKPLKKGTESDLSLSEDGSISPKRSEDFKKLKELELSPRSTAEKLVSSLRNSEKPSISSHFRPRSLLKKTRTLNEQKTHFLSDSDDTDNKSPSSEEVEFGENFSKKYTNKSDIYDSLSDSQKAVLNRRKVHESPVPPLLLVDSDESENGFRSPVRNPSQTFDERNMMSPKDLRKPNDNLSGRQTAVLKRRTLNEPKVSHLISESDDSDNDDKHKSAMPGEYNPKDYESLEVDEETKDLFQLISRYIPQQINITYKFKPFTLEFLPAVGDIDAFLKVYPPDTTINDDKCTETFDHLGLTVLDEPASNQSDPAVLYLQLRAASGNPRKRNDENVVVKKIDNVEKSAKTIEKWIKDISDLHKSKSSVVVRYSESMPDLDDLMQEWPEEVEAELKQNGFPKPDNVSLQDYIATVCDKFKIPLVKKKVQSLYLLFCLYAAIKQSQLYKASSVEQGKNDTTPVPVEAEADQLVLE